MAIGFLIPAGLGKFCCYFFWCWLTRLVCQPLWSGSMWHVIVDDDVEAAPIYRFNHKAGQPIIRPCENHDLHMKWGPTWMESWQKQQAHSKAVPASISLVRNSKIQGTEWVYMVCCQTYDWTTFSIPNGLIDFPWRTIATSHSTTRTCVPQDTGGSHLSQIFGSMKICLAYQ